MSKKLYKSIEDENGVLTLYWYSDEVEPQNGVPISLLNISAEEWNQILIDTNNRLVQMVESNPTNLQKLNDLALNVFRSLIARQLNKK
jgi:hypothetical protein